MREGTGFILITPKLNRNNASAEGESVKLKDPDKGDRFQTPKTESRFTRFQDGESELANSTVSETNTGFTPLIKQIEHFTKLEHAEQTEQQVRKEQKVVTFHGFDKECAQALSTVLPEVCTISRQVFVI
jgi:hypothetical protein